MIYKVYAKNEFVNDILQQFSKINHLLSYTSWNTDMNLTKFISFVSLWSAAEVRSTKIDVEQANAIQKSLYKKLDEQRIYTESQVCREGFRPLIELRAINDKMESIFFPQLADDINRNFELNLFTSKLFAHCDFICDGENLYIDPATQSNEIKNATSTSSLNNFDYSIQTFRSRNGPS